MSNVVFWGFLLGVLGSAVAQPAKFDPFCGPRPIAVILDTSPWAPARRTELPTIAVYADRSMIRHDGNHYLMSYLSKKEFSELLDHLEACHKGPDRVGPLGGIGVDVPQRRVFVEHGTKVTVCGADITRFTSDEPLLVPFVELCRYLEELPQAGAVPWQPRYVELFCRRARRGFNVMPWPPDWPRCGDPQFCGDPRADGYFFVYLQGNDALQAEAFAWLYVSFYLDGRKYGMIVRSVFPQESTWLRAFMPLEGAEALDTK